MRITKKNVRQLISELAMEYSVKLYFNKDIYYHGNSRYWSSSISISVNGSAVNMLSTFFHELGHVYCYNNGIWKSYHVNKPISELTSEERQRYLRVALRAERWVDRWAMKEMKKHFPNIKYVDGYFSDHMGSQLTKHVKKYIGYEYE